MKTVISILLICLFISCKKEKKTEVITNPQPTIEEFDNNDVPASDSASDSVGSIEGLFVKTIENAHQKDNFLNQGSVKFDINLNFGGKERLDATIMMLTNSSKVLIAKKNGDQLLFDGENSYISPKNAQQKGARFDMFTWSYFFGLPYKLDDPGTKWAMEQDRTLKKDGVEYATAKLTFGENVGDAPDDWYLVYRDPATQLIKSAVYIVTFGSDGDISKAEADPHAIVYEDYKNINNIPIATSWKFYDWSEDKGLGKQLGEATLSNISFSKTGSEVFEVPDNAKIISKP